MAWNSTETIGASQDRVDIQAWLDAHDGETPTDGTNCTGKLVGTSGNDGLTYLTGFQSGQDDDTRLVLTTDDPTTGTPGDGASTSIYLFIHGANEIWLDCKNIEFTGDTQRNLYFAPDGTTNNLLVTKCIFSGTRIGRTYKIKQRIDQVNRTIIWSSSRIFL